MTDVEGKLKLFDFKIQLQIHGYYIALCCGQLKPSAMSLLPCIREIFYSLNAHKSNMNATLYRSLVSANIIRKSGGGALQQSAKNKSNGGTRQE